MIFVRCITLLQFTTMLALGQPAQQRHPASVPEQAGAIVRSLYSEVVARRPVGIPRDADMAAFAPYLSKALLHRIDLARACESDYYERHYHLKAKPQVKPQIEWLEFGLFTGGNEKVSPRAFDVERTQSEKDGSFRVYVKLTWGPRPLIWHVAAIVLLENGHFVVDDVIFLKDETMDAELRLSQILASGCDGPRWVGHGDQRN